MNRRAVLPPANILIVKLSAIGDVVHALPVAHALKQCFADARITWIVERPSYDLLTNNPYIDEIIVFDKPKFKSVSGLRRHAPELIRLLRSRRFDLALDLQALFKSAAIAYLSGAPRRLVYCDARELSGLLSERVCGENSRGHVVQRYLDVARALGCQINEAVFPINVTDDEAAAATAIASRAGLDLHRPYVILAPGANWPNKRWPPRFYAALAGKLYNDGLVSVLVGGAGDKSLAAEIHAGAPVPIVDLTGTTSLKQSAYLIRQARAFVGGDTGPTHLAAALGTPVTALYGPTDVIRNGPYGRKHKTLTTPRPCAGCWRRRCPKGVDCLENIKLEEVYDAVQGVLNAD